MYRAPRGTIDILPEDQAYWRHLREQVYRVVALFDYRQIDVPVFEDTGLYVRGVGEGTDIVDKEMYSFVDKGGRDITLRPEFTVGVVRAYLQHGMRTLPQPVKLFSIGPIFRYERAQAGRYRQHTQFNVECIGELDPAVDAEVMCVAWELYSALGFRDLSFQLNSTGCPECRPGYLTALVDYYRLHAGEICDDCRRRLVRNPLRLLDCKAVGCQPIVSGAPHSREFLCPECQEHFETLRGYLDALKRPYSVNHRLVRGLDYYTKTVFEVWAEGIGAQNAVCGGGRYDGLAQQLGGRYTPGIGFATGMERLVLTMKHQGIAVPGLPSPQIAVVYRGQAAKVRALQLLSELRQAGLRAVMDYADRSVKAQFRAANRAGVAYALVLGQDELASQQIVLQDMARSGPRERVSLEEIVAVLRRRLDGAKR